MRTALQDLAWPRVPEDLLLLVPLGSVEQHGPHLPLDTDSVVALRVCHEVACMLPGGRPVRVAPAVAYGASGEHEGFPGTISIGTDALTHLLVELVRSACAFATRVVLVTGHGGNHDALVKAVPLLRSQGHDVAWTCCSVPGGDAHAGRTETSVLLFLERDRVDVAAAEHGVTEEVSELMPALRAGGMRSVSPNGVLGDPRGASSEEGGDLLMAMVGGVAARVVAGSVGPDGMLRFSVQDDG